MAKATSASSSSGIGFTGLLAVLFIGLKLTGYIDWSWWWALAPLWAVPALLLVIFSAIGICIAAAALLDR